MYSGSIVLLNETEDPAENMTEEIEEEDLAHQFFYTIGSGLNAELIIMMQTLMEIQLVLILYYLLTLQVQVQLRLHFVTSLLNQIQA